jgi:hypothetical protein
MITLGRQSGEYSPPALCLALTAISSAISLGEPEGHQRAGVGRGDGKAYVLLQCPALISELSDFLEKDADFARKCFAEVVQVSVRRDGLSVFFLPDADGERT